MHHVQALTFEPIRVKFFQSGAVVRVAQQPIRLLHCFVEMVFYGEHLECGLSC